MNEVFNEFLRLKKREIINASKTAGKFLLMFLVIGSLYAIVIGATVLIDIYFGKVVTAIVVSVIVGTLLLWAFVYWIYDNWQQAKRNVDRKKTYSTSDTCSSTRAGSYFDSNGRTVNFYYDHRGKGRYWYDS